MQTISKYRAPWAIKSGGHASNPGFSSTTGVHISIANLNQVTLSPDNSSVEIGFGQVSGRKQRLIDPPNTQYKCLAYGDISQTWTDVYSKLEGTGFNVVGGRTSGPGVGGFTLGGGYSW